MMDRLLTTREVGELLGVSAETILRWTRAGKLPAIRLPSGAIRFREDDLDDWIAGRTIVCHPCDDCGEDTLAGDEGYMVTADVWPPGARILCIGCLEARIGRRLTPDDFTDCLFNTDDVLLRSDRLLDRLGRTPVERATLGRGSATHPAERRPAARLSSATHPEDEE